MTEPSVKRGSRAEQDNLTVVTPPKWRPDPRRTCPTRTPEPHVLGEFPMTCYNCHVEADS